MVKVETREIARSQILLVLEGSSENFIPRVRENIEEFKLEDGKDIVEDIEGLEGEDNKYILLPTCRMG